MASFSAVRDQVRDREERRRHYEAHIMGLNAYDRHKKFINDYVLHYRKPLIKKEEMRPIKTDQDTLRETYRFIRTEEDDLHSSWEQRLAKRYYDKLFKEYCIADMAHYKDGRIGMRWRAEKEVVSGKGQFVCGNKKCNAKDDLSSYEVNFTYDEAGESKQALVKLRVCPGCGEKLNYRRERDRAKLLHQQEKNNKRSKPVEGPIMCEESLRRSKKRHIEDACRSKGDADSGKELLDSTRHSMSPSSREGAKLSRREDEYDKYFRGMFL